MIALISFDNNMCIKKEEADRLKLTYEEVSRVGYQQDYSGGFSSTLSKMETSHYYADELDKIKDGDEVKFVTRDDDKKEVYKYSVYKRPKDEEGYVYISNENHLVNIEEFAPKCSYKYRISKCIKNQQPTIQNIQSLLSEVEDKTRQIDKAIDVMTSQVFNQKVNVHVGGGLMVTYNDLKLLEDSCTDVLQEALNDGWRIIACCVQPNQRRPDYVLGRFNPTKDTTERNEQSAKR